LFGKKTFVVVLAAPISFYKAVALERFGRVGLKAGDDVYDRAVAMNPPIQRGDLVVAVNAARGLLRAGLLIWI